MTIMERSKLHDKKHHKKHGYDFSSSKLNDVKGLNKTGKNR